MCPEIAERIQVSTPKESRGQITIEAKGTNLVTRTDPRILDILHRLTPGLKLNQNLREDNIREMRADRSVRSSPGQPRKGTRNSWQFSENPFP
jgi:hypothetical protein